MNPRDEKPYRMLAGSSSCRIQGSSREEMDNGRKGEGRQPRQLRRHVHAPVHRFAAVVPPQLIPVCSEEIERLGIRGFETTSAGVEFSARLPTCYEANLALRSASRVLCRPYSFHAGALSEFIRKISRWHWEWWLNPAIPMLVGVQLKECPVRHRGVVRDALLKGIRRRFMILGEADREPAQGKAETLSPSMRQRVFVHWHRNRCQVSLDTSGAHLHQRGYRLEHGGAPLRETLAAAILLRAAWNGRTPLVDGMCGAGTVAIEAAWLARRLPPGHLRSFLFELWPGFQQKTWGYQKREALKRSLPRSPVPILGIDRDPVGLSMARRNAERAGVADDVRLLCSDFLSFRPADHQLPPGLVVLNPPYGKRLRGDIGVLYHAIGKHLRNHFPGWRVSVLAPEPALLLNLKVHSLRFWNIRHGGLPVVVGEARL